MPKPTVHDIARAAGVSLATVDRVLNGRPGVRPQTVEKVTAAIRQIGYVRDQTAANLARRRQYRFVFMLPRSGGEFAASLRAAVREMTAGPGADRTEIETLDVPVHDPHAVAWALAGLDPDSHDGVAIMAPETPQLRDAVARLKAAGQSVVALVSDQPNSARDHFVGINNIAAGRTAGLLMGRFLGGAAGRDVLVVTSSMLSRDSLERRLGFDAVMAAEFGRLRVLPTLEARDDPDRMDRIVSTALAAWPGIAGVYSMGSGNRALLAALSRAGRGQGLTVIAHELTPATRAALLSRRLDAVITQDTGHLVRSALRLLRAGRDGAAVIASQERIRIEIALRENLAEKDAAGLADPPGKPARSVSPAAMDNRERSDEDNAGAGSVPGAIRRR